MTFSTKFFSAIKPFVIDSRDCVITSINNALFTTNTGSFAHTSTLFRLTIYYHELKPYNTIDAISISNRTFSFTHFRFFLLFFYFFSSELIDFGRLPVFSLFFFTLQITRVTFVFPDQNFFDAIFHLI